jgi:hypothetical protein
MSRFKAWMRPFMGVASKYLDTYLGWRRMIEREGDDRTAERWLYAAVSQIEPGAVTRWQNKANRANNISIQPRSFQVDEAQGVQLCDGQSGISEFGISQSSISEFGHVN